MGAENWRKGDLVKVTVSVCGRFHAFNLAQQLLKQGHLYQLITSYPKFEVVKYGIPREKVSSVVIKEILNRAWYKMPAFIRNRYDPSYALHELYDILASRALRDPDICVAFSGSAYNIFKKAKRRGAVTVVERGSAHILYQTKIMKDEYGKLGMHPELAHPGIIEKELKEYIEADYISIPSLFVKRTFIEQGIPENKLICNPYGVSLIEFKQIKKEDNKFRVIYAGAMSIQKGVHYLLQAFSELNLPDSELLLVGGVTDEIRPFFKKYEGHFKSIGHKSQKELYKYYSQSSVFVIMSVQDGFGMVLSQAMACGLPVICTKNTGGEDVLQDGVDGFVIPIKDVTMLKKHLLFLYENPEICRKMGQAAKEKISNGFTWDDYGDRMIGHYKRILAMQRGKAI